MRKTSRDKHTISSGRVSFFPRRSRSSVSGLEQSRFHSGTDSFVSFEDRGVSRGAVLDISLLMMKGFFNGTIENAMEGIITGKMLILQVNDLQSLVMNRVEVNFHLIVESINRRRMYSNLLYALGGEWTEIARYVEQVLF